DYVRDGQITRNDMIDIIKQGTKQYTSITTVQYGNLLTLERGAAAVGMPGYVHQLAANVLETGPAFVANRGGNRSAVAADLGSAVGNWFLGQVHPYATSTYFVPTGWGFSIQLQIPATYQV